jgi:hypothetical protein
VALQVKFVCLFTAAQGFCMLTLFAVLVTPLKTIASTATPTPKVLTKAPLVPAVTGCTQQDIMNATVVRSNAENLLVVLIIVPLLHPVICWLVFIDFAEWDWLHARRETLQICTDWPDTVAGTAMMMLPWKLKTPRAPISRSP